MAHPFIHLSVLIGRRKGYTKFIFKLKKVATITKNLKNNGIENKKGSAQNLLSEMSPLETKFQIKMGKKKNKSEKIY